MKKMFLPTTSVIIAILLISICPLQSNASELNTTTTITPSPQPSPTVNITSGAAPPAPTVNITSGSTPPVAVPPTVNTTPGQQVVGPQIVKETCKAVSTRCQFKSMTACLSSSETGPHGSILVVNDGESSVKVKITLLPANNTLKEVEIPSHQTEKINISANVGVGSSIVFDAGDGNCTIHTGAPAPQFNFYQQFSSYNSYATPTNGAYLLIGISIVIGGAWACCKLKRADRHLDGVPYQELEMGNSNIPVSTSVDVDVDVEAAEGWDQDWDDDWDEDKAVVKSPGGNHLNGKSTNGISSKAADSNGWGNDWDD